MVTKQDLEMGLNIPIMLPQMGLKRHQVMAPSMSDRVPVIQEINMEFSLLRQLSDTKTKVDQKYIS